MWWHGIGGGDDNDNAHLLYGKQQIAMATTVSTRNENILILQRITGFHKNKIK